MTSEYNYDIKSLTTPAATGGTTTTSGDYRIHTFTSSGTFIANKSMNVKVLVVAGGGGSIFGGAGAGGLIYNGSFAVTAQSYSIVVGAGGIGRTNSALGLYGDDGGNSTFSTLTAIGGGAGPGQNSGVRNGGSGGGGGYGSVGGYGLGTVGQGNNGSTNIYWNIPGAGGGAGAAGGLASGGSGTGTAGTGGAGLAYDISGSLVYYAGGGGGGAPEAGVTRGLGGNGGGGAGGANGYGGVNGTSNTGGGGGGSGNASIKGGDGGSGIVIISYPLSQDTLTPASITATSMTVSPPSESPCRAGICTVGVSVTWTNNGESTGSFVPSLTFSGGTVTPTYPSEPLDAGAPVVHTFTISNMTAGSHSICPNPN